MLELEIATYKARLAELRKDAGKFVLIQANTLVGTFREYEDAINEGHARFGSAPFLVKEIPAFEQVLFASHLISQAVAFKPSNRAEG